VDETIDEVPEIRLCEVSNEVEAALVVNLLREQNVQARSDASAGAPAFGGLPFESGHAIFVPSSQAKEARKILSHYPHFKNLENLHDPDL
jgi:hypothetical protein